MARTGPCWKCEKPTRSHRDAVMVVTPYGVKVVDLFTCHECWKDLGENELTELKINIRDTVKAKAMEIYEAEHANDEKPKRIIQDKIRMDQR